MALTDPQKSAQRGMLKAGAVGFAFLLLANLPIFRNLNILAGCIQIPINAFVFCMMSRGYKHNTGFVKLIGLIGMIIPVLMASLTLYRVLLPPIFHYMPAF